MPNLLEWNDPDIPQDKLAEYHRILRAIPPGRKLEAAFEMSDLQRDVLAAGVRCLYGELSEREIAAKLAWLWLPDDLWEKVYGSRRETDEENQCQENHS